MHCLEREFLLKIAEERPGRVRLSWDDLRLTVRAEAPLWGEGLCKLWLTGERGHFLLGTLIPENGCLCLARSIPMGEVRRAGAWPPCGVSAALVWPFRTDRPFPRPDLFCFGKVEEGRLWLRFDGEGNPCMPE